MRYLTRDTLQQAVGSGILAQDQADTLWQFVENETPVPTAQPASGPSFTFTNVLYYLGGMLAIGAMSLFMTLGWQAFGGFGVFAIALIYAALALHGAQWLKSRNLQTPAGILCGLAITLVPLAIYGAQHAMGSWDHTRPYRDYHTLIDWRWAVMELGTLLSGALILRFYRLPFAVMPIAVTLWYMSMDFVPLLTSGIHPDGQTRKLVSMGFGLVMIATALYVDVRSRRRPDYGFWLYLFGTVALWGALSMWWSTFLYPLSNTALIFAGALLARRVLTVFGGLGLWGYLGYHSYIVFKDSILFPVALTALGRSLVAVGIWWQRNEANLRHTFRNLLSTPMRELLGSAD